MWQQTFPEPVRASRSPRLKADEISPAYSGTPPITKALRACCFFLALGANAFTAAAPAGQAVERTYANLPQEIVVTGQDIVKLRELVSEAEDLVYARFNALNDDDLYDIHCGMEAATGTRLKRKVCRPRFLEEAYITEARGFLQGQFLGPPPAAENAFHTPILQEKMRQLVRESPELYEAVMEHYHLRQVLEESRRVYLDD